MSEEQWIELGESPPLMAPPAPWVRHVRRVVTTVIFALGVLAWLARLS